MESEGNSVKFKSQPSKGRSRLLELMYVALRGKLKLKSFNRTLNVGQWFCWKY